MAGGKERKTKPSVAQRQQGGIQFYKSKGQHILKNPMLVQTIVPSFLINITYLGPGLIKNQL